MYKMGYLKQMLTGLAVLIVLFSSEKFQAQETSVMVRVQSKDAKFIGSSMGGAKIIIREVDSGEILAEGLTEGETGNTEKIMKEPVSRDTRLADEQTAGFLAKINLERPTMVKVEAFAPGDSRVKSQTRLWLIPGKDILGDGLVLEMPGFMIDVLAPQRHESISENEAIEVKANIVMMCGCPVTSGGLWDADQYEIKAIVNKDGEFENTVDMKVLEKASTFSTKLKLTAGKYEIMVYAFDPESGNTGVGKTSFIVN